MTYWFFIGAVVCEFSFFSLNKICENPYETRRKEVSSLEPFIHRELTSSHFIFYRKIFNKCITRYLIGFDCSFSWFQFNVQRTLEQPSTPSHSQSSDTYHPHSSHHSSAGSISSGGGGVGSPESPPPRHSSSKEEVPANSSSEGKIIIKCFLTPCEIEKERFGKKK